MRRDVRGSVARRLFPGGNDEWVAVLRIGMGLHVILYCLALRQSWSDLLASTGEGVLSRQLAEAVASLESPLIPRVGWVVNPLSSIGVPEPTAISITWFLLLGAGLLLTVGLFSRTAAVTAWLLHVAAATSGGFLSYGVDNFMTIGLFYVALGPLPDRYTLDHRLRRRAVPDPEWLGFWQRILQFHLCIAYFFGGLTKALGSGWWDGMNMWRALTREPFDQLPPDFLARFADLLPALGIAVWVIELGYPFLIWPRRTRTVWLVLTCALHVGIGAAMGMHLFAFEMIVLNVAAFATSAPATPEKQLETEPARAT